MRDETLLGNNNHDLILLGEYGFENMPCSVAKYVMLYESISGNEPA